MDAARPLTLFVGHQPDHLPHRSESRAVDVDFVARFDDRAAVERVVLGHGVFHAEAEHFVLLAGTGGLALIAAVAEIFVFGPRLAGCPAATTDLAARRATARPAPCPAGPSAPRPSRLPRRPCKPRPATNRRRAVLASHDATRPGLRHEQRINVQIAIRAIRHGSGQRRAFDSRCTTCLMVSRGPSGETVLLDRRLLVGPAVGCRRRAFTSQRGVGTGFRPSARREPSSVRARPCSAGKSTNGGDPKKKNRGSSFASGSLPPDAGSPRVAQDRRPPPAGLGPAPPRTKFCALNVVASRQRVARIFEIDHPRDELAGKRQLQVFLGDARSEWRSGVPDRAADRCGRSTSIVGNTSAPSASRMFVTRSR